MSPAPGRRRARRHHHCRRRAIMTIDLADTQLDALLKRLHLANTRRAWRELTPRAEREEWSYRDFLALLVSEEIAHRQQTRIARMIHREIGRASCRERV